MPIPRMLNEDPNTFRLLSSRRGKAEMAVQLPTSKAPLPLSFPVEEKKFKTDAGVNASAVLTTTPMLRPFGVPRFFFRHIRPLRVERSPYHGREPEIPSAASAGCSQNARGSSAG